MKRYKKYKDLIAYYALLVLEKIPFTWDQKLGKLLGSAFFYLHRSRRKIALQQLKIAFPSWDKKQITKTALASTHSLGYSFFETLKKKKYEAKITDWVKNTNVATIQKVKNTGAIFISGHFANWELATISLDKTDLSGIIISKETSLLTKKALKRYRLSNKWKNIALSDASLSLKIVRTLKQAHSMYMLIDLDIKSESVVCNFFKQKTRTPASVAKLAIKYQKPVVACLNHRTSKSKHIFNYSIASMPPYTSQDTVARLTQKYTTTIEKHIIKYPKQWNWIEPRWKKDRWSAKERQQ